MHVVKSTWSLQLYLCFEINRSMHTFTKLSLNQFWCLNDVKSKSTFCKLSQRMFLRQFSLITCRGWKGCAALRFARRGLLGAFAFWGRETTLRCTEQVDIINLNSLPWSQHIHWCRSKMLLARPYLGNKCKAQWGTTLDNPGCLTTAMAEFPWCSFPSQGIIWNHLDQFCHHWFKLSHKIHIKFSEFSLAKVSECYICMMDCDPSPLILIHFWSFLAPYYCDASFGDQGSAIFVACNCVFHRDCLEEWRGLKDKVGDPSDTGVRWCWMWFVFLPAQLTIDKLLWNE